MCNLKIAAKKSKKSKNRSFFFLEKLFILPFVVLFILIYHDIYKIMRNEAQKCEKGRNMC
jgi:hypothetical protein